VCSLSCKLGNFALAFEGIGELSMSNVTTFTSLHSNSAEWQLRVDLAASFRLSARFKWNEAVANHFSVATSPDGRNFLMNPRWKHFSRIKASELLHLNVNDKEAMQRPDAPDLTAWSLHARLHATLPQARCIIHLHPKYATVIASLADPEIKPIDQNTARFFNRVAWDINYGGMANTDEEGDRLALLLGNKSIMMMGNHGILVCAATVAEAYDLTYYLEKACCNLVLAYQTGQPLHVMSHAVAEKTAQEWEADREQFHAHFAEMKAILDSEKATYAD
jgi:ribulose-5-phosphate 4-epimerase/fuculose-1-phosphate aldolase